MTIISTQEGVHSGRPIDSQRPSPLNIPELLERIFSFLENDDVARSVAPVCRQWFLMNRYRLVREFTWNSLLSAEELSQELLKFQRAGRLNCYLAKSWTVLPLWDDLVGAVREKHKQWQLHQLGHGEDDQLTDDLLHSDGVLDIQALLDSPLRELSLSGHVQLATMFPPLLPFLGRLTMLEMRFREMARFHMSQVLTACPLLERIHFESTDVLLLTDPWLVTKDGSRDEYTSHRQPLSLRSIVLYNVRFSRADLESLLSISPHLEELKVHTWIPNPATPIVFSFNNFNEVGRARLQAYWDDQTSVSQEGNRRRQQQQQPVHIEGIGPVSTQVFLNGTFTPTLVQSLLTVTNVVTTLELRRDSANTAIGLQKYLCNSPHLLHLRAPTTELSIHHLDIHQRLPFTWNRMDDSEARLPPLPQIWACRQLRTLHLAFHSYGSGSIDNPIVSRLIFGYVSKVCRRVRDLEIYGLDIYSLETRTNKPNLCMYLKGGLCYLAGLAHLERLRVGSFDASVKCTPSDLDWMVALGHTAQARKHRQRVVAEWDACLAKEAQEETIRSNDFDQMTTNVKWTDTADPGLESRMRGLGLLADVKAMLLDEMETSDFEVWPRLTKIGLYTDMEFLWPVSKEYHRLSKDWVAPTKKSRLSQMFSFSASVKA
ncbi:hypothetical protein BGX33_010516 [Mortierella sp. NVP41]|nr:hypothetical protein BGX33_010516 [Mortierella sp. NVP41]